MSRIHMIHAYLPSRPGFNLATMRDEEEEYTRVAWTVVIVYPRIWHLRRCPYHVMQAIAIVLLAAKAQPRVRSSVWNACAATKV